MSEVSETALWAWFLFHSGLPTARAKALLETWLSEGRSLREALARPRAQLGVTPQEAARLHPPADLPPVTALRWDNGYAPAHDMGTGLLSLPLKLRPALLFYTGEVSLLSRPLVYLAPSPLGADDRQALHEALSLLVDEPLLLGIHEGSAQVPVLLEEMAYTTGEALLFAHTGLDLHRPSDIETSLIEQGRLVVVSPLPPRTAYQPAWDAILQQVAVAAARRVLLTGDVARAPGALPGLDTATQDRAKVLALTAEAPRSPVPAGVQVTATAVDLLLWVDSLFSNPSLAEDVKDEAGVQEHALGESSTVGHENGPPYWVGPELTELVEEELGPPPSPDEILATLSKGGNVPEELRRRLEGGKKE